MTEPAPLALGATKSVYIETYGCQMNVADSDLMVNVLAGRGFRTTTSADQADLILINTCAVREKAEERVFARAAELGHGKKQRPHQVLGIVGCMAEHLKEKVVERAPAVDIVAGPDSYRRLADMVDTIAERRRQPLAPDAAAAPSGAAPSHGAVLDVKLDKKETYEGLSGAIGGDGVSGFVTVQRGCDKFCTFCVVPFTRGRERGVAPRDILRQVREFAERGYKEVVLLGQTVNSYQWEDVTFARLLAAVAEVEGIERVRFTSPYPVDFTDDVVAAIAGNDKISKYVHLPLQSGSDAVLARMKRGYTVQDFRDIVRRLRQAVPTIAFSTDILSGFSGETEADHAQTLAVMEELRFDSAFMFSYSERSLTYASKNLPDDVAPDVKKRRLADIVKLQERLSGEIFAGHVGRRERVLVHGPSKRDATQMMGRTDGFKSVILPSHIGAPGELVDVEITRATMATLFGTPL